MWLKIIKATRNYFHISHREAKGTVVLLALSLLVLVTTFFYRSYSPNTPTAIPVVEHLHPTSENTSFSKKQAIKLVPFNPNTFTNFESLGVPSFLSKRIINYRSKGGVFKVKTDLKKIYGFPDSLYHQLAPYIVLTETNEVKQPFTASPSTIKKITLPSTKSPHTLVDISTADSAQLTIIKGIGPTLASRIVKYRNSLGGFHSTSQLKEIYGLNSTQAEEIVKQCTINSVSLKQISLNTTSFKEMVHHPYLEYEDVKRIFDHKRTTGGYNQVEDLTRFQILADSTFHKLLPYLKL